MQRAKNIKAFTLVEIVIVIVILGIMVALLAPRLIGASMEKAAFSEAVHQLSAYVTAEKSYAMDHNDTYTGDCTLLEIDVTFKGFANLSCNDGNKGHVSIKRTGGPGGTYTVKANAAANPPGYSCADCPSYLIKLLPQ